MPGLQRGRVSGVAGCQRVVYPSQFFSLGSQSSAHFMQDEEGILKIVYRATPSHGISRTLYVTLRCVTPEEGDKVIVTGERRTERAVYDMTLYSQYACPRHVKTAAPLTLSIGSILLISVAAMVFVYMVSGVLFQRFVRKAKGLETLPHAAFWSAVPGLVKDGVVFVKKRGRVDQIYQPVP